MRSQWYWGFPESFLVFPTILTLYALLGGIGAALDVGVVDGVALALAGGVGSGDGVYKPLR